MKKKKVKEVIYEFSHEVLDHYLFRTRNIKSSIVLNLKVFYFTNNIFIFLFFGFLYVLCHVKINKIQNFVIKFNNNLSYQYFKRLFTDGLKIYEWDRKNKIVHLVIICQMSIRRQTPDVKGVGRYLLGRLWGD